MEKEYKILGNYIRLVDERNKNLAVTKLLGVSISKKFIPSIANIVGTDLSNYKIVRTGQFAYGPVTSRNGEKISIAYLKYIAPEDIFPYSIDEVFIDGMMNTEQRIKMIRLIEKIDKNPEFSQKIGIRNTSAFVSDKSKKITTDSHV